MDPFRIPELAVLGQPRMGSIYDETGTLESGYSDDGPFHCAQCIHKTASDEPFCVHPKVVGDSRLQDKLVLIDGRPAVKIDLEHGCCKYVRPPEPVDDDDRMEKAESA